MNENHEVVKDRVDLGVGERRQKCLWKGSVKWKGERSTVKILTKFESGK